MLSYLSDLSLVSDREGLDNPFIALVARFLFVCVGTRWLVRGLLLDWYLGSQKPREILTLLYCITLSSSRENQRSAQEVAIRIAGAVAGEAYTKSSQDLIYRQRAISGAVAGESTQKSTYQVPITIPYLPHYIICHLPLVFLSPTSPLPFYSLSLFRLPLFRLRLVCSCVGLLACHDGSR